MASAKTFLSICESYALPDLKNNGHVSGGESENCHDCNYSDYYKVSYLFPKKDPGAKRRRDKRKGTDEDSMYLENFKSICFISHIVYDNRDEYHTGSHIKSFLRIMPLTKHVVEEERLTFFLMIQPLLFNRND